MTDGSHASQSFTWHHLLYRLYSNSDELLYVGRTGNLKARFQSHASQQYWWPEVSHATVELLADLSSLINAERKAIREEEPRYNVVYNDIRKHNSCLEGIRMTPNVQKVVLKVCTDERRTFSNAVNLLVIEALIARGLGPATI